MGCTRPATQGDGAWRPGPARGQLHFDLQERRRIGGTAGGLAAHQRSLASSAFRVALVRLHDPLHQRVTHDVESVEEREGHAIDAPQHFDCVTKSRTLLPREVHLGDVAGDDGLRAEAEACQEHLHLLDRGVLRFVEDDERVIERAAAHECERRHFDDLPLDVARNAVETHHLVERVVHRPQVRIDLLRHVARQEAEPFAGFDRRPHEHDATHAA